MEEDVFLIKSYGLQELALKYSKDITPDSATRRFKRWIDKNQALTDELTRLGWNRTDRVLTPGQVKTIVYYLGEP